MSIPDKIAECLRDDPRPTYRRRSTDLDVVKVGDVRKLCGELVVVVEPGHICLLSNDLEAACDYDYLLDAGTPFKLMIMRDTLWCIHEQYLGELVSDAVFADSGPLGISIRGPRDPRYHDRKDLVLGFQSKLCQEGALVLE